MNYQPSVKDYTNKNAKVKQKGSPNKKDIKITSSKERFLIDILLTVPELKKYISFYQSKYMI